MTKFRAILVFTLFFITLTLISCAPATSPESPATEEPFTSPNPDFENTPSNIYAYDACSSDTWVNSTDPKFNGFIHKQELIDTAINIEMDTADQVWLISLAELKINDRVVYFDNWTVNQIIQTYSGSYPVQELNPEKWITKAKELSKIAPDLIVVTSATWILDQNYDIFQWEINYLSCTEN